MGALCPALGHWSVLLPWLWPLLGLPNTPHEGLARAAVPTQTALCRLMRGTTWMPAGAPLGGGACPALAGPSGRSCIEARRGRHVWATWR